MTLTDTLDRYVDRTATPSDVCNAVLAEIAARPEADTIRDALALMPADLHADVAAYLYDLATATGEHVRVASRCGGEETAPQPSPLAPEVLAAINAWWRT